MSEIYDKRNAKTLSKSRKVTPNHRQSEADFAILKECAKWVAENFPKAKLISFHKRRKRLFWNVGKGLYMERRLIKGVWYTTGMGAIV